MRKVKRINQSNMEKIIEIPEAKCPVHGRKMYCSSYQNNLLERPARGIQTIAHYKCLCCDSEFRFEIFTPVAKGEDVSLRNNAAYQPELPNFICRNCTSSEGNHVADKCLCSHDCKFHGLNDEACAWYTEYVNK